MAWPTLFGAPCTRSYPSGVGSFGRVQAVRALADERSKEARAQLLQATLDARGREAEQRACLEAARRHLEALKEDVRARVFGHALQRAAPFLTEDGRRGLREFLDVDPDQTAPQVVELRPLRPGECPLVCSRLGFDPTALALAAGEEAWDPGPELEAKYALAVAHDGALVLGPSSWALARRFQRAIARSLERDGPNAIWYELLEGLVVGELVVPSIACVHVVVLGADGKVVVARRDDNLVFDPGVWSATFEEQLTSCDLTAPLLALERAVTRGLQEELGLAGDDVRIEMGSLILDTTRLQLGVTSCCRLRTARACPPTCGSQGELGQLRSIASRSELPETAALHPSFLLRMDLASTRLPKIPAT